MAMLAALGLALLTAGCGLNPLAEDEPQVGRLADSAARASLQTYGILARAVKKQEHLAARAASAQAEAAPQTGDQLAALPPTSDPGIALRVRFASQLATLDPEARADLAALSTQLQRAPDRPIRLHAYWSADDDDAAASAKIMALKRAMLVRDFLIDQGLGRATIEFPRIEDDDEALDVVDIVLDPL